MKFTCSLKLTKPVILTICLSLIIVSALIATASKWEAASLKTFTGTVLINNEQFSLSYGKETDLLNIAPPAALDSLNLHPAAADTITVTGILNKGAIVCSQVIWKGKTYILRDATGTPVWEGTATWTVNAKKCIGCRLCYMNCPSDAITMVNNKAVIDQSKCTGCNTCIVGNGSGFKGCPVKAITK